VELYWDVIPVILSPIVDAFKQHFIGFG